MSRHEIIAVIVVAVVIGGWAFASFPRRRRPFEEHVPAKWRGWPHGGL